MAVEQGLEVSVGEKEVEEKGNTETCEELAVLGRGAAQHQSACLTCSKLWFSSPALKMHRRKKEVLTAKPTELTVSVGAEPH